MSIRILSLGEIVGKPGIYAVKQGLKALRKSHEIDLVIANGEGTTGGFGIGRNHSIYLSKLGIDAVTTGEKTYYKKDIVDHIGKAPYMLRPANYPPGNPGRGWRSYDTKSGPVAVLNLLGQAEFSRVHLSNPFSFFDMIIDRIHEVTPNVILQFHAATTAEKQAMFYHTAGRVSAVIGTHSKALTADGTILDKGTAVLTDNGRCGSSIGVGALDPQIEIHKFLTGVPERSSECWDELEIQGALITISDTGVAERIETVRLPIEPPQTQG